jgi:two-component system response regulator (stage 0 sporulation protein F)
MLPRVLLVEDDDIIREIYATKFELEGFPTAVAENGRIALGVVQEFKPEIILLDMMMPVMGGLEFMQQLNADDPKPTIIIFSNISAATLQMQQAMSLGASDYWVKSDYTPERVTVELARRWKARSSDVV